MFDNILHQSQVINQLKEDIKSGTLAPSILFSGPEYAGKGTAALELARVLCCKEEASPGNWTCACSSCAQYRNMATPDLLIMGKRRFYEEIAASSKAFLCQPDNAGSRMLFIRSVRKLLARFNAILWEDDSKLAKLNPQISALEEDLEDINKNAQNIVKKAAKLETELAEIIPIAMIRRAAYWSHLAPVGNHKCIIIEGAENTQEGAKNSLLKILEEPPPRLTILLTSSRPTSLLPTMLSRLREYRFAKRNAQSEIDVLNRIFRESKVTLANTDDSVIQSYLTSFLPVKIETLYALAAFFAASVAALAIKKLKAEDKRTEHIDVLISLGKYTAPIAEKGGIGRPASDIKSAIAKIIDTAEHFEIAGLFSRFLQQCAVIISAWLCVNDADGAPSVSMGKTLYADLWRRELERSRIETASFNIAPPLVLERLFETLRTG